MEAKIEKLKNTIIEAQRKIEIGSYPDWLQGIIDGSIKYFANNGFPTTSIENWRGTDLSKILKSDYELSIEKNIDSKQDISRIFACEIHNFNTHFFANFNGVTLYDNSPITELNNGVIVGSLKTAIKEYNELVAQYYSKNAKFDYNSLVALNSSFVNDGLFIYVPDNTEIEIPLQLVNLINDENNLFVQTRNLVIIGKNSKVTFLHCDDSLNDKNSFKNSVSEYFIGENSYLEHYKLQNKDITTVLINTSFFSLQKGASLISNIITFNSGTIRNEFIVELNGANASADLSGLYLIDKTQFVDNQIVVKHNSGYCNSNQTFKGILDDEARANFNGRIYVAPNAVKTEAYQSNRNLLLTDEASVMSKPFLEIFNDDVRCSHGSTVGQLNKDAMFYLRQRGICEKNARLLMMYAFADEVVRKINLEPLRQRTENMVQRRLRGELSNCEQCILHCNPAGSLEKFFDKIL